MDFLRASEALLRSSQPLLPVLAPSAHRTPTTVTARLSRQYRPQQAQCRHACRAFSTSHSRREQNAAAAREPEPTQPSKQQSSSAAANFSALLDSALDISRAPFSSRSLRTPGPAPQRPSPSRMQDYVPKDGDSLRDLLDMVDNAKPQRPANASATSSRSSIDFYIGDPNRPATPAPAYVQEESPVKLNSSVGRTIKVDTSRGMDVGRAFRSLEMKCAQNSVKRDFMRQRFHERPGLKRKRLKSERWRKRFKEGFRGTVAMVKKMRAQGW